MCLEDRPLLEANAAGIDIGAREIYVAVPPDRDKDPVRVFTTFTEDWKRWLSGWSVVGSPRWQWRAQGCTGFRSTTSLSRVNYFFALTTIISPGQRQLPFNS